MHIKSKLRSILGNLLVKASSDISSSKIINKQSIKNIPFEDNKLPVNSLGCLVRVLAIDEDNANQILDEVTKHKDSLGMISVHVTNQAIGYSVPNKQVPLFTHSVIVQIEPGTSLKSSLSASNPCYIKSEILENNEHENKRVVVDFSSPNIAKPFHFGHLKSTILGNYLSNLNRFVGNNVTRLNYLGDWGTQYGLLELGLEKFNGNILSSETCDNHRGQLRQLLDIYVKANDEAKSDENFYSEAKKRFRQMDKGEDSGQIERWHKVKELSMLELRRSYGRLGIEFDEFEFESEYAKKASMFIEQVKCCSFIRQLGDGAVIAQIEKNNRPLEIPLMKCDGSSLYITRDIVAALERKEKYNYDKLLYVVGVDQEKHFYCLKEIIKNLGHNWAEKGLIHVKMGKVLGMSSRSGSFVLLSDIMDEATKHYMDSTRNTPTSKAVEDSEVENVAKHLALSALFVFDMRNARTRHYKFDWKEVMLASPRSGINLQTTFARLSSLLEKASLRGLSLAEESELDSSAICCVEGLNLLSCLDEIDTELHSSYWLLDPSPVVNHALRLCKAINRARRSDKLWVVNEKDERKAKTRLSLFKSSHRQLEMIIRLLGLSPLDKV